MAKLDRRVVAVWRWSIALVATVPLLVAIPVGWILLADRSRWLIVGAVLVYAVAVAVTALTVPEAMWSRWEYRLGEQALELRHGIVFHEHSVIPWSRVQHVDVSHGPLDRRFGLAQLKVHTASAASDAELPGLDAGEAETLRLEILDLYKEAAAEDG